MSRSKRILTTLAVLIVAGAVAFHLADPVKEPVVDLAAPVALPALQDLAPWLAQREAALGDITPGAEIGIRWADPQAPARTPLSLVYLHGYSATRQEVSPLCEQVADTLGANVFFARLRGHGRSGEAFAAATVDQWIEDGQEALAIGHALGEQVAVLATSSGATLATWLAAHGADVDALVLMSPNFQPRATGASLLTMPGRGLLVKLVLGDTREWQPESEAQGRYWTHRYPSQALFPMADLVELVRRSDLGRILAPTLVLYCPDDEIVRVDLIPARLEAMGSRVKRLVEVPAESSSHHVLAGDILSPGTTQEVAAHIQGFLGEVFPDALPSPR